MIKRYIRITDIKAKDNCLNCGGKLFGRRRKYCSNECMEMFYGKYFYNSFRERIIKERKKCAVCGEKYGLEIHHKKPLKDGGNLFDDENIEVLCRVCHVEKHREIKQREREEKMPLLFEKNYILEVA